METSHTSVMNQAKIKYKNLCATFLWFLFIIVKENLNFSDCNVLVHENASRKKRVFQYLLSIIFTNAIHKIVKLEENNNI